MKTLITTALMTLTSLSYAGKFEIIGEGIATRPADFVRLAISVNSECFSTALSARRHVDGLVQKASQSLARFMTNIPDQLSVAPEANVQKTKTAYINGETIIICDENHNWTSATTLEFKLQDLQQLAELQDELLSLTAQSVKPNAINVERLTMSLLKPTPGVLAETWNSMSDLALQRAHQNALRQVRILSQEIINPKIELAKVTAASTGSSGQLIYDQVSAEGDSSGSGLGLVSVKLAREFTFKVEAQ
jgi:hypothetical protein